jgi:bifunctional UDP-N-acetylglucosamine pyrophosphorylase / glucosamine-1-phosphate N-acetyltransferase
LLEHHQREQAAASLLTALLDDPKGYGRILRNARGALAGIVEEKDASHKQREIREVNAGIYAVSAPFLFAALRAVKNDNQPGRILSARYRRRRYPCRARKSRPWR